MAFIPTFIGAKSNVFKDHISRIQQSDQKLFLAQSPDQGPDQDTDQEKQIEKDKCQDQAICFSQ